MKKPGIIITSVAAIWIALPALAGNLRIASVSSPIISGCGSSNDVRVVHLSINSSFSLTGVSGTGSMRSTYANGTNFVYTYTVDMSGMPLHADHCVKLLVYFGYPDSCDFDSDGFPDEVIQLPGATTDTPLGSANINSGQIEFAFDFSGNPCLYPGLSSRTFAMRTDRSVAPKNGVVVIVHTYPDPTHGTNVEERVNVQALVPNLPPQLFSQAPVPSFQGVMHGKSSTGGNQPPVNGPFDFQIQLYDSPLAASGVPVSEVITSSVPVENGLFTANLNLDPTAWFGSIRWLDIAVRPSGSNTAFESLGPRLPVAPAPQALYAYTAGSVAGLAPGQGVTSLNGLTDDVVLQAGPGILLRTNGNTIIIMTSAVPGPAPAPLGIGADKGLRPPEGELNLEAIRRDIRALEERLSIVERQTRTSALISSPVSKLPEHAPGPTPQSPRHSFILRE